jgi:phospholipase C
MSDITRRSFLRGIGLAAGSALAAPYVVGTARASGVSFRQQLRHKIEHIVVIFQENRSFDHYFGTFRPTNGQRVANLLDQESHIDQRFFGLQKNPAGIPYPTLPLPVAKIPGFLNVELPNLPFHLAPYVPAKSNVHWDPVHHFFRMMAEVNNGKMDRFVALAMGSGSHLSVQKLGTLSPEDLAFDLATPSGPVLGYYKAEDIPFYHRLAHRYVLFDHFYQAMSGGSTGNALYLVACRSCVNPGVTVLHMSPYDPKEAGLQHAFFDQPYDHRRIMINDLSPIQGPTGSNNFHQLRISPPPEAQRYQNIGDRLSSARVDWAWYNENWNLVKPWALKTAFGPGDGAAVIDSSRIYVAHHNPFQYYPGWFDYVKQGHIRDAEDFREDARQGKLPGVSFIKASGAHDEHPADSAPYYGMEWAEQLVRAVAAGPAWDKTAIFITYDEGGGFWDSVPPVVVDDYGFGTRIPALLVSPWARSGMVDHHVASTASILKLIENRFGLAPLTHRDRNAYDMSNAFDWSQTLREFSL